MSLNVRNRSLKLEDLNVAAGSRHLLGPLKIAIHPGECVGLVGESGSGKSLTALSMLGLLPKGLKATGRLLLGDHNIELMSEAHAALRGSFLAWIPQDPLSSLHPMRTVGSQLLEILSQHRGSRDKRLAIELFERVQLPDPARALRKYPHEFSGGQRQRVSIAMALASAPKLLIADEPTSALDARIARDILDLLDTLRREDDLGLMLISHDLPLVGAYAQQVLVLQKGDLVEFGPSAQLFSSPQHAYTRELIAADHLPAAARPSSEAPIVLKGNDIEVRYRNAPRPALNGVHLELHRGEGLALVGESGSGKSTLGRALMRLLKTSKGSVTFEGVDLLTLDEASLRSQRSKFGIVFQDPYASLNPRMKIRDIIGEPLRVHGMDADLEERVGTLIEDVGLTRDMLDRYPHQFSGGQRQRIAIARALATDPQVLICDEAVSALDAHYRAAILELLAKLKQSRGVSLLFITHDLVAAAAVAERIAVLENGTIVERGLTEDVLRQPQHAHTKALLDARPS